MKENRKSHQDEKRIGIIMQQETEGGEFLKRDTAVESQIHEQVKEIWTEK